jgi:excisionase family DNA binding protein
MEKTWRSIAAAAQYFGLKSATLYSLIGRGRLPAGAVLRIGRQIRLNVAAIEAGMMLSGHGKGPRG